MNIIQTITLNICNCILDFEGFTCKTIKRSNSNFHEFRFTPERNRTLITVYYAKNSLENVDFPDILQNRILYFLIP